jgi:hypothetical protein
MPVCTARTGRRAGPEFVGRDDRWQDSATAFRKQTRGFTMTTTTAKERIHQLIDQLTEEQAQELEISIKLALIPEDDEPETEEERQAVEESKAQIARGETISSTEAKRRLLS